MQNLRGKILSSILIVHCTHRVRLEDISQTGTWTKTYSFQEDGQTVTRTKGARFPPTLLKGWRLVRQRHPALFQAGVLLWAHPTAYMDEVISAWHSELVSQECSQAVLSQDCFAGELTAVAWG